MVLVGMGAWLAHRRRKRNNLKEKADMLLSTTATPFMAYISPSQGSSRDSIDMPLPSVDMSVASSFEPNTSESMAAVASTSLLLPLPLPGRSPASRQKREPGKHSPSGSPPALSSPHVSERTPTTARTLGGRETSEHDGGNMLSDSHHNSIPPSTEVAGLRAEITDLRRVVQEIQRGVELPPEYTAE
ncbi:hypothetical protein BC628DRAFT_1069357 [Trametes gibbosa]|nr:hypothetical protein BC628DRAFT_1069357 [Trametes gibbosa]